MTTSTLLAISVPKNTPIVEMRGGKMYVTEPWLRFLDLLANRLSKIDEAAREYEALNTGTATTTQIATALNTFMASATET